MRKTANWKKIILIPRRRVDNTVSERQAHTASSSNSNWFTLLILDETGSSLCEIAE